MRRSTRAFLTAETPGVAMQLALSRPATAALGSVRAEDRSFLKP
jgi:hypothetical protein